MFCLEIKGKLVYYSTIESAVNAANEVFKRSGIILGVFRVEV